MKAKHSSRTKSTLVASQIRSIRIWVTDAEHHDRRTINSFLMYTKMNHSSEWAKFFDELAGCYHHKQKGRVGCGSRNPYGHRERRDKCGENSRKSGCWENGQNNLVKKWWKRGPKKEAKNAGRAAKNNTQNGADKYIRCNDETQSNFGTPTLNSAVK